jgi:hypothetical protein
MIMQYIFGWLDQDLFDHKATNLFRAVFVPSFLLVLVSDLQATIYSICSHHNIPSVFFPIILTGFSHAQNSRMIDMFPAPFLIFHLLRSDPHVSRHFLDFTTCSEVTHMFPANFLIFHLLKRDPHVSRPFLDLYLLRRDPHAFLRSDLHVSRHFLGLPPGQE